MNYIGIDPGISKQSPGGIARIKNGVACAFRMPSEPSEYHSIMLSLIDDPAECHITIEKQWPRPMDGKVSLFKLANNYGQIIMSATCLGVPYALVTPQRWKKDTFLASTDLAIEKKTRSFNMAVLYYPDSGLKYKTRDHGMAEALLIARWASKNVTIRNG